MKIIIVFLLAIAFYCVLAMLLKIATFKMSGNIHRKTSKKPLRQRIKQNIDDLITSISHSIAKYVPITQLEEISLQKILASANINETPKQHHARNYVVTIGFIVLFSPLYFISVLFIILALIFSLAAVTDHKKRTIRKGNKRRAEINKELHHFTPNFADSIKFNRNVINIFDTYIQNFDTELAKEFSITVADMRTGSHERALQKLEMRVNSPLMSELVRGIISTIRGDDMTLHFDNLVFKMASLWEQSLKQQALRIKPKLSFVSTSVAMYSLAMLIYMLVVTLGSSASTLM